MDQLAEIQDATTFLLKKAKDSSIADLASAIEKATDVVKLKADLEQSENKTRILALEESKLKHTIDSAGKSERWSRTKDLFSQAAPLITVLVLAGTLILQGWQFWQGERDKREAAEDAQWREAVKTILQTSKVPPGIVALNPFLKSTKYGELAKDQAVTLLATTDDKILFTSLFGAAFVPVGWSNLGRVIELDRALRGRWNRF